jgi:hypothetical protein
VTEKMRQFLLVLLITGLLLPSCTPPAPQPVQPLSYQISKSSIRALDSDGKLVWEHPTQFFVDKTYTLGNGNLVFAEMGKGAGGFLWCLSPTGKVLWKSEGRMWIVGTDRSNNILVNGGSPHEGYYSRLYSASGALLWKHSQQDNEHQGMDEYLRKDDAGNYVVPKISH